MGNIPADDWRRKPGIFFSIDVVIMVLLVAGALYLSQVPEPTSPSLHFSFQSILPLWVPWAGALGGATISLVGVVSHYAEWDPAYTYWHLGRSFLGVVSGTIGVLIVVLVLKSVSAAPSKNGQPLATDVIYDNAGIAVLAVIAFVLGYREATFRTLVQRVVDVILTPGDKATATVAFVPSTLDFTCPVNGSTEQTVHLFNGTPDALTLALSMQPDDVGFTATATPSDTTVPAGESRKVTVKWTPTAVSSFAATLSASLGGHTARLDLKGTGTQQ